MDARGEEAMREGGCCCGHLGSRPTEQSWAQELRRRFTERSTPHVEGPHGAINAVLRLFPFLSLGRIRMREVVSVQRSFGSEMRRFLPVFVTQKGAKT